MTSSVGPPSHMIMSIERINQGLERSDSLLWTPYHKKAHVVLPVSVELTSDEFLAENKHWLDLLLRVPFDEEAQATVKTHVLQKIDQDTIRLVPDGYRSPLSIFCAMRMNDTNQQNWFQQSPLPKVTVNRCVPLPKMVEIQPMRRAVRKLEDLAFKLKDTVPVEAAELKHASDTVSICCDVQYQAEMEATARLNATEAKLNDILLKIQLIDGQDLTAIVDEVNEEQQKKLAEFRGVAVDAQDEDGERAHEMTDKQWLFCYRNMDDAKIQQWIDLFVSLQSHETDLPEALEGVIMERGGDRLWRVLNNAMSTQS